MSRIEGRIPTSLIPRREGENPLNILIFAEELEAFAKNSGVGVGQNDHLAEALQGVLHPGGFRLSCKDRTGDRCPGCKSVGKPCELVIEVRFTFAIEAALRLRCHDGMILEGRSAGQAAKIRQAQEEDVDIFCEPTAPPQGRIGSYSAGR